MGIAKTVHRVTLARRIACIDHQALLAHIRFGVRDADILKEQSRLSYPNKCAADKLRRLPRLGHVGVVSLQSVGARYLTPLL